MLITIRRAKDEDETIFKVLSTKLRKFNRNNHHNNNEIDDDSELVIASIKRKTEDIFRNRNKESLILIADCDGQAVGYAVGIIYKEAETADNGTGIMGLLDELFVDDLARGFGIGNKLIDQTLKWFKEKGINRVKLHAYSWNTKAKKHYERKGFKEYAVSYEKYI